MKKVLCVLMMSVLCFSVSKASFAFFGSLPNIDENHIARDIICSGVETWKFQEAELSRIKILDAKYDEDTARVYVFIRTINSGHTSGCEGKIRLEYEYAAADWNLLHIKLISLSRLDHNDVQKLNLTVLHSAARQGDTEKVQAALTDGIYINARDDYGFTPFMRAVQGGHVSTVHMLLDRGANVNAGALFVKPLIGEIRVGYPAKEAGLKSGDLVVNVQGKTITRWEQISEVIRQTPEQELKLKIKRGDEILNKKIIPRTERVRDIFGKVREVRRIGITVAGDTIYVTPLMLAKANNYSKIIKLIEKAGAKE